MHPAKAKAVIMLFMEGGPSQVDTFDPKPALNQLASQRSPNAPQAWRLENDSTLVARSNRAKVGKSSIDMCDQFVHMAESRSRRRVMRLSRLPGGII